MKYRITLNGRSYEAVVERGEAVVVSDYPADARDDAAREQEPRRPARRPVQTQRSPLPRPQPRSPLRPEAPAASDSGEVKAPLPGVLLDVRIRPGDRVKKGDVLMVLEAMKMENDVTAPRDGAVASVNAVKGASAAAGDVLAVLE